VIWHFVSVFVTYLKLEGVQLAELASHLVWLADNHVLKHLLKNRINTRHTHTQPFYGPFSGTTLVNRCQKKSSGLFGAMGDIRGRHTDSPARRHSVWTNQQPISLIPHFYAECPFCRSPPNLCWLGTGTKYAGLHSQRLGLEIPVSKVIFLFSHPLL